MKSLSGSEVAKKKRMVLKYPDGTYAHAVKDLEADSWREVKMNAEEQPLGELQIEDEIEFLVNNLEFILEPENALRAYLWHRKVFALCLFLSLAFEVSLYFYLFSNMNFIVTELAQIYREISLQKLALIFKVSNSIDLCINALMYTFGFYALFTHKAHTYSIFHGCLILAVFSRIVISYLNIINLLMFIIKIVLYLYARFLLSLLYSILIAPGQT